MPYPIKIARFCPVLCCGYWVLPLPHESVKYALNREPEVLVEFDRAGVRFGNGQREQIEVPLAEGAGGSRQQRLPEMMPTVLRQNTYLGYMPHIVLHA